MTVKRWLGGAAVAALLCASAPTLAGAQTAFAGLIDQAKAAMMADPAHALKLAQGALAQPGPADAEQPIRIATAKWLQGEALLRLNRPKEAGPLIDEALATADSRAPNSNLHGRLTLAKADVLAMTGDVQGALQRLQAAYKIFEAAREPRGQAMALQNIGSIYLDAGDFPKAQQYYAQSAEIYRADPALLVSAYNNVGNAHKAQGKYALAMAEYRRALAIAREMGSPLLEARILANMASAEVAAGRLASAEAHVAEGLRIAARDPAAQDWRPYLWGVAAQAALKRNDLPGARVHLQRTFEGLDLETTSPFFRDFHETAFEVYRGLGEDRLALEHLRAFKRLDDQARELAASTNAALISAQFDFANQESRIAKLKAGQLERDIKLANQRNAIAAILLTGAGVLVVLLAWGVINMRRSRNQIRAAHGRLQEANEALEKALKARTEFLATTSHEIRTPLNGILGMTQVILADRRLPDRLRDKVSLAHGAGETMLALVDDILDMAKIETGNLVVAPVEMDLHKLLTEAARLWTERAKGKRLSLRLDAADAPVWIEADITRLRQIVFNLMSNAIKFTDDGEVRLAARVEPAGEGETLVIEVSDSGIGIPPDKLGEVFESFRQVDGGVTRKYGGTGLGLAICRQLALAMGGDLSVKSTLGHGSVFTVRLPLCRSQKGVAEPVAADPVRAQSLEDAAVLLLEANPLAQSLLRAALHEHVRSLEVVSSAREAQEALSGRVFDLLLAEGAALADETTDSVAGLAGLAQAARGARICVMWSGSAEDAERLLASGADRVARKPISTGDLTVQLQALCAAGPVPAEDAAPDRATGSAAT